MPTVHNRVSISVMMSSAARLSPRVPSGARTVASTALSEIPRASSEPAIAVTRTAAATVPSGAPKRERKAANRLTTTSAMMIARKSPLLPSALSNSSNESADLYGSESANDAIATGSAAPGRDAAAPREIERQQHHQRRRHHAERRSERVIETRQECDGPGRERLARGRRFRSAQAP